MTFSADYPGAAVLCENCEKWFCLDCDEDGGPCLQCGDNFCGPCRAQGTTCFCPPIKDE